ncbi:photosynthetic complex assembly protein 2 [Chloroherpeton thalassium ATCC 35110]|uniref:Photosynthetic complex assembly protein 2 n=1 Tax=Chloroherpeton thalassium (strain ATCC 35110 / GB-78) TaxID=517418 RepID=B3QY88_CHLT3|nr:putative photosynthetic complex assembly protein PuhE [Chloroherpeton thalassium]ACF15054.1 photosynthetic complex assembly protein 2 [Chloroherpeton thalassium ATCC 35110]
MQASKFSGKESNAEYVSTKTLSNENHQLQSFLNENSLSSGKSIGKHLVVAGLYSLAIWWISTAVIIYFNFQPVVRLAFFLTSLTLAIISAFMTVKYRDDESIMGTYITFTGALFVWGFVEVSFYTGYIVGPPVRPLFTIGPSWEAFHKAVHRSIYHEMLIMTLGLTALWLFRKAKNKFGLYTFFILWFAHQSCKLNVFFGVSNTGSEFIPDTVSDMAQFMTVTSMNWLFPFSISLNTIVAYKFIRHVKDLAKPAWQRIGYILVGMMALLALVEHWLLVLPLNESLWDVVVPYIH